MKLSWNTLKFLFEMWQVIYLTAYLTRYAYFLRLMYFMVIKNYLWTNIEIYLHTNRCQDVYLKFVKMFNFQKYVWFAFCHNYVNKLNRQTVADYNAFLFMLYQGHLQCSLIQRRTIFHSHVTTLMRKGKK